MSSFWMPKKQPLYAPMIASFGGGSARGYGRGKGKGFSPATLLSLGFTEVSPGVFRKTSAGSGTINFGGANLSVHVIGAGGWSGRDGMGYGNCGGGGGGGGAVANFYSVGEVAFQVGSPVDPPDSTYTYGQDGAWSQQQTITFASPTSEQVSWFISPTTIFGSGGGPGWYQGEPQNGIQSGAGGSFGGSAPGLVGSKGGDGGGCVWNADGDPTSTSYGRSQAESSTYGGGGGGTGNVTYAAAQYGASGALGGQGGRGGVPKGNTYTAEWRENTKGTLGGGNGGQAKWVATNEVGPYTVLPSSAGVIQITIL